MSSSEKNTVKKSPLSSGLTRQGKGNKRIIPLTREFFTQLIKLETDFFNKNYNIVTLDELIQFYAKAVEYYDSIKDEISSYFMFKIQDILATQRSLKMLLNQQAKIGNRRGTGIINLNEVSNQENIVDVDKKVTFQEQPVKQDNIHNENILEVSSGEDDDEKHINDLQKKRRVKKTERAERISISTMKNQKQRFVNFFYKMETQKANEKQNMNNVINDFESSSGRNDVYVRKDVDVQRDKLRKRLDKRKIETFMSHTMNTQSFQFGISNVDEHDRKDDEVNFESFLNELEEKSFFKNDRIKEEADVIETKSPDEKDIKDFEH